MMAQQMPQQMQQQMPQQMPQGQPMAMYGGGAIPSRHQFGEQIDPRLMGEEEDGDAPWIGKGGKLFDYTDPWDYLITLGMLAPIPGSRVAASTLRGLKLARTAAQTGAAKAGQKITEPILEAAGKRAALKKNVALEGVPVSGVPNPLLGKTIPVKKTGSLPLEEAGKLYLQQRGKQGLKYINPKAAEFRKRTLPIGASAAFISSRGEGDVEAGDIDETVTSKEIERLKAEIEQYKKADAEAILLKNLEEDSNADLTEGGRLFEAARKNIPEDETYQDYLSTLEGMEESRKGQVLMDLGSAIANAGHGGDIAKGIQEAGTKARTEKLALAKEKAGILSGKRAADFNLMLQIAALDTSLQDQEGKTLRYYLSLFEDQPDLIEGAMDSDDPIGGLIAILSRLGVDTSKMKEEIEKVADKQA